MRERLGILGIVAFVVVDVVLVALAIRHTRAAPPDFDDSVLTIPSASAEAVPDKPTRSSKSDRPAAPENGSDEPLYMSLARDGSYIKATRGSCQDDVQPVVSVSTNEGRSLSEGAIPDATEILRVQANGADDLWVVALDRDCEVQMFATGDGGDTWRRTANADAAWYLVDDPTRARVHTPEGTVDTPCTPISLSTIDAGALRLLCENDRIIGTDDTGRSWVTLGSLEDAVAIRFTNAGDGYAVAPGENCDAAVFETANGGARWDQLRCFDQGQPRSIAAESDLVAVQVGDDLHVSTGGSNWRVL